MKLRPMILEDIYPLVQLGDLMTQEAPAYRGLEFDGEKTRNVLLNAYMGNTPRKIWVFEMDGFPVGFFAASITNYPFHAARRANDMALYIHPGYRGTYGNYRVLKQVIKAYKEWADEMGADTIDVGVSTGVSPESTVKLFEHLGGNTYGYILRMN